MGYIPSLYTATKAVFGVAAAGIASTAILLYRYQRSLVYPSSFPAGSRTEVLTPDEFDIETYDNLTLDTPDGEKLHAFLLAQRKTSEKERARNESNNGDDVMARRPTVLFLHANAGNMGHRLPLAAVFYKRFGCNVLMLSYRGYGLSTGQPSEVGIRIDAQTALDYIKSHPILNKTVLVVYGQSLGGAVAIDLASRNTKSIHALILENTFLSIPELVPHVLPALPSAFLFLCREYWPSGESIRKIPSTTPALFLSGRKDDLVPPPHMDALFERCNSKDKVWMEFKDGMHNDTCVKPAYFDAIGLFMAKYTVPRTAGGQAAAAAAFSVLSGKYEVVTGTKIRGGLEIVATDGSRRPIAESEKAEGDSGGSAQETSSSTVRGAPRTSMESSESAWVEMSARDADGLSDAPAMSAAPQDTVKEASKGNARL